MIPLRAEDITLFCEDKHGGRSQRILDAAVSALHGDLRFATAVRTVGVLNKNDVVLRAKFARAQKGPPLRVLAVRDRDFLTQPLVAAARGRAFAKAPQDVMAWPLPRHSIESYLLDEDLLVPLLTEHAPQVLATRIEEAAIARRWLDVIRGTLEDLTYRLRKLRPTSITHLPMDRATALDAVMEEVARMGDEITEKLATDRLASHLDALTADMDADGPLRHRVDGRELVYDMERVLGRSPGSLLDALCQRARRTPPAALVTDLRTLLDTLPAAWREG